MDTGSRSRACGCIHIKLGQFRSDLPFPNILFYYYSGLQEMREERAKGWTVVPMWSSNPWMGPLLPMVVKAPRIITQKTNVLQHPSSAEVHLIMTHTHLMACFLSGNNSEGEVYHQKVQWLSWHRGDHVRCDNIDHTLTNGHHFVMDGMLIPLIPL